MANELTNRVLSVPLFDPGVGRREFDVPQGTSIAEIVAMSVPGIPECDLCYVRVMLVTDAGMHAVESAYWLRVRPKPGVRVVVRLTPGKDYLRSILLTVVSIAAVALGQFWAGPLSGVLGISSNAAAGIIGLGVTPSGTILVNPFESPNQGNPRRSISD